MSIEETVSFSLEINIENANRELRRLETVLYRTIGLAKRMGLPENLDNALTQIQRLITVVNQLRLAYRALQLARMAAGDPVAWGMAIVSVAEVGVSLSSQMEMGRHRY